MPKYCGHDGTCWRRINIEGLPLLLVEASAWEAARWSMPVRSSLRSVPCMSSRPHIKPSARQRTDSMRHHSATQWPWKTAVACAGSTRDCAPLRYIVLLAQDTPDQLVMPEIRHFWTPESYGEVSWHSTGSMLLHFLCASLHFFSRVTHGRSVVHPLCSALHGSWHVKPCALLSLTCNRGQTT